MPVRAQIENGRFVLTAQAIDAAVTSRSRALLLNTPWNPVGTVFRESELRAIADVVTRQNLVLISDEIYEAITYEGCQAHLAVLAVCRPARAHGTC